MRSHLQFVVRLGMLTTLLSTWAGCGSEAAVDLPDAGPIEPDATVVDRPDAGKMEPDAGGTEPDAGGAGLCGVDEHVEANACVSCADGGTNAAGDDPTGGDTSCDPADACSAALGVSCDRFEQAYLKAENAEASDSFGGSVALYGDTLAVGAIREDSSATGVDGDQADNGTFDSGAVYVFRRSGTTWSQEAYFKGETIGISYHYGYSVALSEDKLAVGAPGESLGRGAVYVYSRSGTTWSQEARIEAPNADITDSFGQSVALDEDTLAVAMPTEDSSATGVDGDPADNGTPDSGAVYVFTRSGTTWSQEAYIKASNTGEQDRFGGSIALSGDTLAVGAVGEASDATGVNGDETNDDSPFSGAVYVFTRSGTTWSQEAYIKADRSEELDRFGYSVALSGDTLAVGAPGKNGGPTGMSALHSGAAYVFTRSGTTWSQEAYLEAELAGADDVFGSAVALYGDTLAVGAEREGSSATGVNGDDTLDDATYSGAAYVFTRSGTTWSQAVYLKASNTDERDRFGAAVALYEDTLAIGAYGEDSSATGVDGDQTDNEAEGSGAVYVRVVTP